MAGLLALLAAVHSSYSGPSNEPPVGGLRMLMAPGDLDPTFSADGKLIDGISRGSDAAYTITLQPDGKIVAAGRSQRGADYDLAVVRYNLDGSLDTSFDTDGIVLIRIQSILGAAAAVQADGKIVAGGSGLESFSLVRFNADGSKDASFGNGGTTSVYPGRSSSIILLTNGKILVVGSSTIYRFNLDGSLDTSFGGGDGIAELPISTRSGAIQADGKIVAAGFESDGKLFHFAVVRCLADGTLDQFFGFEGLVVTPVGYFDSANAVAIQADGKIVAAGREVPNENSIFDLAVVRYNSDGSLDTTFDLDGIVTTSIPTVGTSFANSVAVQDDGRIVAGGVANSRIGLARFAPDGSLDTTFDGDGKLITQIGSSAGANYVAMRSDGKIMAGGFGTSTAGGRDFALARYNTDGSLDPSLDGDGIVTTDFGRLGNNTLSATVIQPDGKIVAVGSAIARYDPDGSPDMTFNGNGKTFFQGGNSALAADIQADGKIVVAGKCSDCSAFGTEDLVITRYNSGGTIDTSFATGGSFVIADGAGGASSVHTMPDGRIFAAGFRRMLRLNSNGSLDETFGTSGVADVPMITFASSILTDGRIMTAGMELVGTGFDFALARFNANGILDTSFDGDGLVTTPIGTFDDGARSLAIQPDGKIVTAGYSVSDIRFDFAAARYDPDGALDTSFGGDGKVTTPIGSTSSSASSVGLQSDGKIVASGTHRDESDQDDDFILARYNADGSLDTTFGSSGVARVDFEAESNDQANGMALDDQGRAVVVGVSDGAFAIARFILGPASSAAPFDFDGDGRSDISVFRPANSNWYLNRSAQGFSATQFGISTDKITPADLDGDGKTDISVYRDGTWYWLRSSDGNFNVFQFGLPGDVPVPADYTGDGHSELAVYRNGIWWAYDLAIGGVSGIEFGIATDRPVVADYDGDGRVDQAVYRDGVWHLNRSTAGYTAVSFGLATDRPIPADYDGDRKADLAVYRDGAWYVLQSSGGFAAFQFGVATDIPTPADYDGDGRTDAAVFRDGAWYLRQTASGFSAVNFGVANDKPIPAAYLP